VASYLWAKAGQAHKLQLHLVAGRSPRRLSHVVNTGTFTIQRVRDNTAYAGLTCKIARQVHLPHILLIRPAIHGVSDRQTLELSDQSQVNVIPLASPQH
jgi:hypothetical protein